MLLESVAIEKRGPMAIVRFDRRANLDAFNAEVAASMPASTVRMVKQSMNATAGALHVATAFADADLSQVTVAYAAAAAARSDFRSKT